MPPRIPTSRYVHPLLRARDWQDRPQVDEICDWWRESSSGVCALIGIGGAGKTAMVDRFLQVLPGAIASIPGVAKSDYLVAPDRLFVFSFYDAPNADHFFDEIANWLEPQSKCDSPTSPSSREVLRMLETAGNCLLVLDGLEKVQDDGVRGGTFGQIIDRRLSDLVLRLATGYLPTVAAIITTRFAIAELDEALYLGQATNYRSVAVEEISVDAGIQLLKQRGVHGTQGELERLVRECGQHALSVDLAGGYLAEFADGRVDASFELGDIHQIERDLSNEPNPRRRAIVRQEYRFARIASRYRDALAAQDPASLALMERVCLFRLGVSEDTLFSIFTGPGKEYIAGKALAVLNQRELSRKLQKLVGMRLLDETERSLPHPSPQRDVIQLPSDGPSLQGGAIFTVHPAVRDGFLNAMDRDTAKKGHDAVRTALKTSLSKVPGPLVTDSGTLDLFEEIIHHSVEAGLFSEALDLFENRMEGFVRAIALGDYARMDRILRALLGSDHPAALTLSDRFTDEEWRALLITWGMSKLGLGQSAAAKRCIDRARELITQPADQSLFLIEGEASLLSGNLPRARELAQTPVENARTDKVAVEAFRLFVAACAFLMGRTEEAGLAFEEFDQRRKQFADKEQQELDAGVLIVRGEVRAEFIRRMESPMSASAWCERTLKELFPEVEDQAEFSKMLPRFQIVFAQCLHSHDPSKAWRLLDDATEWAIKNDSKELLCLSALAAGRFRSAEGRAFNDPAEGAASLKAALANFNEGLHIAYECGFGIYHIDLLLERAGIFLAFGEPDKAINDVTVAITDGFTPRPESGLPRMLPAADPNCAYAWGQADGLQLLVEALLLKAAQLLGSEHLPATAEKIPEDVRKIVTNATAQLDRCISLRRSIRDPGVADAILIADGLKFGRLTTYPIQKMSSTDSEIGAEPARASRRTRAFVSYSHKDAFALAELKAMLAPVLREGTIELWDDTKIRPGQLWKNEIAAELSDAKVAILLVSDNFLASDFIAKNELPPLLRAAQTDGVTIFWICLSPCLYEHTAIMNYQAAHDVTRPLDSLSTAARKQTLKEICHKLIQSVTNE